MATVINGQTCLEARGIEERTNEIVRNDYTKDNEYGPTHPNALSDGDPKGKGTGHQGHTHFLPDCTKPTNAIDYSNFDTSHGGGLYDIKGRNGIGGREAAIVNSLYNADYQYGLSLVDTTQNVNLGQYVNENK
jgi:hypothetical protein